MRLKIEYKPLQSLKRYENNPRHNAEAVEEVAESIRTYGFLNPILIDSQDCIAAGDTRYLAAEKEGLDEVPCINIEGLTPEQIRGYRIADNKTAETARWDYDLLAVELEELAAVGYDLLSTGFHQEELDEIMKTIDPEIFGTEFELPSGEKNPFRQVTFSLANEQADLIFEALEMVKEEVSETFGNENSNGNRLYEVIRQWVEQRK